MDLKKGKNIFKVILCIKSLRLPFYYCLMTLIFFFINPCHSPRDSIMAFQRPEMDTYQVNLVSARNQRRRIFLCILEESIMSCNKDKPQKIKQACTSVLERWACWDVDFLQKFQRFSMKETNGGTFWECHPHPSTSTGHVCNTDQRVWMNFKLLSNKQFISVTTCEENAIIHFINK